ncbi:MAG: quinone-dependent dihydroorotate dehydrogenase [Deltaproteobacteria bacterium]|nr:MAG: quinone-dependent dihydroorotate dehydrogenase [Deltaproteobacteria bacterium]
MYRWMRPFLFLMDAERAHQATFKFSRWLQPVAPVFVRPWFAYTDKRLQQELWGLPFANPVGLAAGMDKNAELVRFWEALGMGFVEVGSVTAHSSGGNAKPRAFRLPLDRALINRMGLNNQGAEAVAARISEHRESYHVPLGINIAKTHSPDILGDAGIDDFVRSFELLAPHADYVALNVSCPNTTEGKTFEDPEALDALLRAIFEVRQSMALDVPVLVKLSPPPTENLRAGDALDEILDVAQQHAIAGWIATNTASNRAGLQTSSQALTQIGHGGLSGQPVCARSTALIRYLYQYTKGALPIIGVGGIHSPQSAYEKILAGASLLQVYTGLIFEGPGLVKRINKSLSWFLERDGFANVQDAVGANT